MASHGIEAAGRAAPFGVRRTQTLSPDKRRDRGHLPNPRDGIHDPHPRITAAHHAIPAAEKAASRFPQYRSTKTAYQRFCDLLRRRASGTCASDVATRFAVEALVDARSLRGPRRGCGAPRVRLRCSGDRCVARPTDGSFAARQKAHGDDPAANHAYGRIQERVS